MLFYQINSIHGILDTFRVFHESMAEQNIEKCSILTYFGNKKILKNKKMRPRATLKFQKKNDKLMIFVEAPYVKLIKKSFLCIPFENC